MSYPDPNSDKTEAEAVTCEARALERETIADSRLLWPGMAGPAFDNAQHQRLRAAATEVVAIAWAMQDPAWDNPYADLGAAIIDNARNVLAAIRAFEPRAPATAEPPPPPPPAEPSTPKSPA